MKKKRSFDLVTGIFVPLLTAALLVVFLSSLSELSGDRSREERRRLEDALQRAVVACYALEGAYPPDLAYLEENYGIRIDRDRYTVAYVPVAENLMPDITVLEK